MAHLSLSMLGPFQATLDGQPVTGFESSKVRALLAYLAVEADRPHPRELLAGLLWPDYPDRSALRNLRYALSNLRQVIGDRQADPPFLCIARDSLQFNTASDHSLDLTGLADLEPQAPCGSSLSVDRLEQVVAAYRGGFLEGFACDSAPFEEWVLFKREQVGRQVLWALRRLATHCEQCGKYEQAITYARKQLELEAWDEEAHRQLMRALALSGQRNAALAHYESCRGLLMRELGVEPSGETEALYASIRDGKVDKDARKQVDKARESALMNVPIPLTSFVGRQREMQEVRRLLDKTRLLTLTGAGGCGKTRLAIQVASDLAAADRYKNGVWWVDLAALSDPALVPQTVATVFDLRESSDVPLTTVLVNYLRAKELLLVLDNCEHLIEASAQLVEALLSASPKLQILATSREALGLTGEVAWYVPSLESPDPHNMPPLASLPQYDAIRLFTERAHAVATHWQLNDHAEAAARICCQLDGIPLAIELAAARLKVLAAEQIAARLDDRFQLLTGGSRTALPRHQTLRAAIDWSFSLLTEEERVLLRRLAVFAGGWSLEAVQAVCSCDPVCADDILDLLAHLVDKSLVIFEQRDSEARYRMIETIRQYARDRLLESSEAAMVRGRHLDYYLKLAQTAEPKLHGSEQFVWLDTLELEHNNLRAALEWSQGEGRAEQGLELAAALLEFWELSAGWSEGRELVANLLTRPEVAAKTLIRANGLLVAGTLHYALGDWEASRRYLEELVDIAHELGEPGKKTFALGLACLSLIVLGDNVARAGSMVEEGLAIARSLGIRWVIAQLLLRKWWCLIGRRDFPAAQKVAEESLALWQSIGNKRNAAVLMGRIGLTIFDQHDYATARWYVEQCLLFAREIKDRVVLSNNLNVLGGIERVEGQYDLAKKDYLMSLEIAREIGRMGIVMLCLVNLGAVSLYEGDIDSAKSFFTEALALAREWNKQPIIAFSLMGFAGILAMQQKAERAAQLLAVFQTFLESGDVRTVGPEDEQEYQHYLTRTREQLDEATFNAAWEEGRKMTLEQAIEYALKA